MTEREINAPAPPVYGIYEGCVGVDESSVDDIVAWYRLQGFEDPVTSPSGLGAKESHAVYGPGAGGANKLIRSIRLQHTSGVDHGLVRLMVWSAPTSPGLGLRPMALRGGRWTASLTDDVLNIANRGSLAQRLQPSLTRYIEPQWTVIYGGNASTDGAIPGFSDLFEKPLVGVREMLLFRAFTRQVFFQRFDYSIPTYGKTAPKSPFKTSQTTHFGIIVEADSNDAPEINFYEQALGLMRARDCRDATTYKPGGKDAATNIWDFPPDATGNYNIDFDDPRSSKDWKQARSGRLKIARYSRECRPPLDVCEDGWAATRPGALGLSLYTYRTPSPEALRARVVAHGATSVTEVQLNEFGERCFGFNSPDGYTWNIIEGDEIGTKTA